MHRKLHILAFASLLAILSNICCSLLVHASNDQTTLIELSEEDSSDEESQDDEEIYLAYRIIEEFSKMYSVEDRSFHSFENVMYLSSYVQKLINPPEIS